jgi:hypothetical protein
MMGEDFAPEAVKGAAAFCRKLETGWCLLAKKEIENIIKLHSLPEKIFNYTCLVGYRNA